jgi:hypothetical protein
MGIAIALHSQIILNEASNRNYSQISDEDGEQHDWIEIYNNSEKEVDIGGWGLSDSRKNPAKWILPKLILQPKKFQIVQASGLNIKISKFINHWESAILPSDTFSYLEAISAVPDWNLPNYDVSSWKRGRAGFGYGNNDDSTITSKSSIAVYIRKTFFISDTSVIVDAILHVDYDDGFVAYLNGIEIARSLIDGVPEWNTPANTDHNALMWQGRNPEKFKLDFDAIKKLLKKGNNVFAIEVHNRSITSSDLSLIPFLSFGLNSNTTFFQPTPKWFVGFSGISLHTNFKISSNGEKIFLCKPDSIIVDSLDLPHLPLDGSIGKETDGSTKVGIFTIATPGKSNNTSKAYTNGYEPSPLFNYVAGFYDNSIDVSLRDSSTTGEIRFTTDRSEPDETSVLYNGKSIHIDSTQTIKAKCFSKSDKLPSKLSCATFFISVSHILPVISVTTPNKNLYGKTGIFDNWQQTWNKPCYVEFFDATKHLIFSQEAGIQIDGGAGGSRQMPQHSVRIEPGNSTLGEGDVNYRLIPDKPNHVKYSSFYLRNGSNQYSTLQYKDALEVKAIAKNTGTYYSGHTPVVVYVNGGYFGVYELREKLNAEYFEQNYAMKIDSIDILTLSYYKGSKLEALEGSTDQFWKDFETFKTLNPTDVSYVNNVSKFLDIDSYTDYIIAQSWICNTDWPQNNIRAFRNKSTNYKWRFAVMDVEWSLSPNGWSTAAVDHFAYMQTKNPNLPYHGFWLGLMNNDGYKNKFINRFADLMNTNYSYAVTAPMEQEFYDQQYPEMTASFKKWGNSSISAFTTNHRTLRAQLKIRSDYVRKHIQTHYNLKTQVKVTLNAEPEGAGQIQISTVTPVEYPWTGIYFSDIPIKIIAKANPGYKFAGWKENNLIPNLNIDSFTTTLSDTIENFTATFEQLNELFKGITISEIHYKNGISETTSDWVELYNAGDTAVCLSGWHITDKDTANKFFFKATDIIKPNARLVVVRNTSTFNQRYPEITDYTGPFHFKLSSPIDGIKLINKQNKTIVEVNYSDLYPWPLNGYQDGRTLELRSPTGNLSDPSNWFAGCKGGSPGKAYKTCPVEIFIDDDIKQIAYGKSTLSVYPNPAQSRVNVNFSLSTAANNSMLNIYNIFGIIVKTIQLGSLPVGNQSISIDLSNVPEGMIIIRLQSGQVSDYVKMLHVE